LVARPLVTSREAHDAFCAAQDALTIEARSHVAVLREPRHFAVHSAGYECVVAGDVLLQRDVCARKPHGVKPEVEGHGAHPTSQGRRLGCRIDLIGN
jgi:hypothetical protein